MKQKNQEVFEIQSNEQQINKEKTDLAQQNRQMVRMAEMNGSADPSTLNREEEKTEGKSLQDMGLPMELIEKMYILASDANKASSYFKPVVENASALVEKKYSDMREVARDIGNLMDSIFYYLDNRGASLFSTQRKARRGVCNDVLTGVGKYLYNAEPEFKDEIQRKVCYLKTFEEPELTGKAAVNGFVREYGYTISNESVNTEIAKRRFMELSQQETAKDATQSLSRIRLSLEGLNAMMTNKMPPAPGDSATEEEKKAYENEIRFVGFGITKMHRAIIASCQSYIDSKNADKRLVKLARDLIAGCEHDSKFFANGISEYIAGHKGSDVVTWGDAIAQKGSESIQLADASVQKMGAGTSVIYRYKTNNKNKYFKEEEKVSNNLEETLNGILEKIRSMPDYKEEYEEKIKTLEQAMKNQISKAGTESYNQASKNLKDQYNTLITLLGGIQTPIEKARRKKEKILNKNPLLQYLYNLGDDNNDDNDPEFCKFVCSIVTEFLKKFNSDYIAVSQVKIEAGSTLSNRNVATSRMADLMGISHMVMKSETQEVQNGKRKIIGNVMEEARGQEASKAYTNGKRYSSVGVNQMIIMQVFDLICGQVDRNMRNYYVKTNSEDKITDVFMLDNDMSFGNLTKIDGNQNVMSLAMSNSIMIEALSPEIKAAIKRLDTYSEGDLGFIFGDIISEKEISSLKKRINTISESIKEYEKKPKSKQEKKIAKLMEDPHFRAVRYQYLLYNKVNSFLKNNNIPEEKRESVASGYMSTLSYLKYDNLLPYEEIKAEYEELLKKGSAA